MNLKLSLVFFFSSNLNKYFLIVNRFVYPFFLLNLHNVIKKAKFFNLVLIVTFFN